MHAAEEKVLLKNGNHATHKEITDTLGSLRGLNLHDAETFMHLYEHCKSYTHSIPADSLKVLRRQGLLNDDDTVSELTINIVISALFNHRPGEEFVLESPYA